MGGDYDKPEGAGGGPAGASTNGRYVPPSMRAGAGRGAGESMRGPGGREDWPTLRVTNVSDEVVEGDFEELFGRFGRVQRVYIGRDHATGAGKGFAYVSFYEKDHAQKAMEKVHKMGYANLILNVQWSRTFRLFLTLIRLTAYPQNQESSVHDFVKYLCIISTNTLISSF